MSDTNQPRPAAGPDAGTSHAGAQLTETRPGLWTTLKSLFSPRSASIREDLQVALDEDVSTKAGNFTPSERAILRNVLSLGEKRVDDVMVPRADIEAVDIDETLGLLIARFREAGHSRLPIYDDTLDHVIGMVHIKDALQRLTAANDADSNGGPIKLVPNVLKQKLNKLDLIRKLLFVPPSMPVGDLLALMQTTRVHMAMVIDEYGGTDGLVTIEDLLEAVVGEIEDEHDDEDPALVRKIDENTYVADARVELSELREVIGPDFEVGDMAEDVDTLGGLLFDLIDRVPVRGEIISRFKGFEFEIMSADPRRIKRVRILRRKRAARPARPKPRDTQVQTDMANTSPVAASADIDVESVADSLVADVSEIPREDREKPAAE